MGMNNFDAVMAHRKGTLHLVAVAFVLLAAIVAGVAFALNRPHTTVSTVASVSSAPEASPAAPATSPAAQTLDLPQTALAAFSCGSSSLSAQSSPATAFINAVRTGSHPGYDRVVIQFGNGQPGSVSLRPQAGTSFINSPRGDTVTLSGHAGLQVVIRGADAHTTYAGPYDFKTNGPALMELRRLEDFEGQVQWGLGLARSSCYRSFVLTNPTRLVIDVQGA